MLGRFCQGQRWAESLTCSESISTFSSRQFMIERKNINICSLDPCFEDHGGWCVQYVSDLLVNHLDRAVRVPLLTRTHSVSNVRHVYKSHLCQFKGLWSCGRVSLSPMLTDSLQRLTLNTKHTCCLLFQRRIMSCSEQVKAFMHGIQLNQHIQLTMLPNKVEWWRKTFRDTESMIKDQDLSSFFASTLLHTPYSSDQHGYQQVFLVPQL